MELIPVSKNGEYMEVHPTALGQHKNLGWQECEKQEIEVEENESGNQAKKPKHK